MEYEVILSGQAKEGFRKIVSYLLYEFGNEQAAANVINDMEDTITRLSSIAGSLKLCDEPGLRAAGYRTIHFKRHKHFLLYRIIKRQAYVVNVFHDLQDYEGMLK